MKQLQEPSEQVSLRQGPGSASTFCRMSIESIISQQDSQRLTSDAASDCRPCLLNAVPRVSSQHTQSSDRVPLSHAGLLSCLPRLWMASCPQGTRLLPARRRAPWLVSAQSILRSSAALKCRPAELIAKFVDGELRPGNKAPAWPTPCPVVCPSTVNHQTKCCLQMQAC